MSSIKGLKTFLLLIGVACMPLFTSFLHAAQTQDPLALAGQVNSKCNFGSGSITMVFGSYDPVGVNASSPKDALTTFSLSCTKNQTAVIGIDTGLNPAGLNRRMTAGASKFMTYQLYKDAGRTSVWGTSGGATVSYTAPNGSATNFTVYGRIPAGQDTPIGNYTDTVTITATF